VLKDNGSGWEHSSPPFFTGCRRYLERGIIDRILFEQKPKKQTYDSAFSASLALRFNVGQQLAHATSRKNQLLQIFT